MLRQSELMGEFEKQDYTIKREYIDSSTTQIRLFHTKVTPPQPKYTICIVHGFGEHSSRFLHVADFFAKNSFQVLMVDLRGFGYSGGPKSTAVLRELENDVITLLRQARQDLPLFLYGHSMGGLICIKLLLQRPELNVSGCIITSPLLGVADPKAFPKSKKIILSWIGEGMGDFIINSKVNPSALTKDTRKIPTIATDPMMTQFMCLKMMKSISEATDWVQAHQDEFSHPILLLHGRKDTVTSYQLSRKFIHNQTQPFKEFYGFENGYHELHHDEELEDLLERSLEFMHRQGKQKAFSNCRIPYIPQPQPKSSILPYIALGILALIPAVIWRKEVLGYLGKKND